MPRAPQNMPGGLCHSSLPEEEAVPKAAVWLANEPKALLCASRSGPLGLPQNSSSSLPPPTPPPLHGIKWRICTQWRESASALEISFEHEVLWEIAKGSPNGKAVVLVKCVQTCPKTASSLLMDEGSCPCPSSQGAAKESTAIPVPIMHSTP